MIESQFFVYNSVQKGYVQLSFRKNMYNGEIDRVGLFYMLDLNKTS